MNYHDNAEVTSVSKVSRKISKDCEAILIELDEVLEDKQNS